MKNNPTTKLTTETFTPSKTIEGVGATWARGSVEMHAGTCGGEDILRVTTSHKRTGNKLKFGMTVEGLEGFIKVGTEMLERIKVDRATRN